MSEQEEMEKTTTVVPENKPVAAFTLAVVGLALQAIGGLFLAYMAWFFSWNHNYFGFGFMGPWMMFGGGWPWMFGFSPFSFAFFLIFAAVEIALGVIGVVWMNSANLGRIRTGSTLVLIASIIAFPTMWGFMIGSLLMLIGSILGLTWQPSQIR
ncbi:MAG: hypothetical protein M1368_01665 [Thaumarchaeota archaeon]|nr:hypothetical protein [Nitrososphaerota archaeon]